MSRALCRVRAQALLCWAQWGYPLGGLQLGPRWHTRKEGDEIIPRFRKTLAQAFLAIKPQGHPPPPGPGGDLVREALIRKLAALGGEVTGTWEPLGCWRGEWGLGVWKKGRAQLGGAHRADEAFLPTDSEAKSSVRPFQQHAEQNGHIRENKLSKRFNSLY